MPEPESKNNAPDFANVKWAILACILIWTAFAFVVHYK